MNYYFKKERLPAIHHKTIRKKIQQKLEEKEH